MTRARRSLGRAWWAVGLAIAVAVVMIAAAFASADPDGLERVAEDQGFDAAAEEPWYEIIPDYEFPGLEGTASTLVAGLVGIAVVFLIMLFVGRALARRRAAGG